MIALMVLSLAAGAAGQVELRAGQPSPSPDVMSAGLDGLVVGESGRAEFVIGWDRVLSVGGPLGADAAPYLPLGEALWRARTRLERGDAPAAEADFERLLAQMADRGGPMPAVAAEGLLRCRLRRGSQVGAIEPWLAWLAARSGGDSDGPQVFASDWSAQAGLDAIMDPATGLIPAVPPIWLNWSAVRVLAGGVSGGGGGDDALANKANDLAALYRHSAEFEAGIEEPFPAVRSAGDSGVALVLDIVLARSGTVQDRAGARERLAERLTSGRDGWMEAWCRSAIGRSLIREADPETRRSGVVELLHLPARFSQIHPYLAGLALAEASVTLGDLGDSAGAGLLRKELIEHYPDHPALAWEPIRLSGPGAPAATGGSRPMQAPAVIPLEITEYPLP